MYTVVDDLNMIGLLLLLLWHSGYPLYNPHNFGPFQIVSIFTSRGTKNIMLRMFAATVPATKIAIDHRKWSIFYSIVNSSILNLIERQTKITNMT